MTQVAVLYHSGYGHTQRVAQYVAEGAGADLIAIDADGNISDAYCAAAYQAIRPGGERQARQAQHLISGACGDTRAGQGFGVNAGQHRDGQ